MREIIYIDGMTCTACSGGIERALKKKSYIREIQVDLLNKMAIIDFDEKESNLAEIFALIKKLGYKPRKQGVIEKLDHSFLTPKKRIILALFFTLLTLYLSMLPMLSLSLYEKLTPIAPFYNALLQMAFTLVVMHMGRNFYLKGFSSLLSLHPTMDTLVMLGSGSAFIFSLFQLHSLPNVLGDAQNILLLHHSEGVYFESICVILLFILIGKNIEERAKNNTQNSLQTLASLKEASVIKIIDGEEERVNINEVKSGDILKITPQESILVDGVILQGYANIDCSSLNGESLPISKKEGDTLYSGSLNLNTTFLMQASKSAENSTYQQILNLVQNALISKAPIARVADKISAFFVPSVIILALYSAITWYFLHKDFQLSLQTFCNVLLISCPCALGLATPLALNIATKLASSRGIFFKDAQILELIGKTSMIFFDKTGTLTQKQLHIKEIYSSDSLSQTQLLQICSSLECQSHHIIAQSILEASKSLSIPKAQNISIQEGLGISGEIEGVRYKIGSAKNFSPSPTHSKEGIEIFIGESTEGGDKILGCILLEEKIKTEAKSTLEELKNMGVTSEILSGDRKGNVEKIAKEFHISFTSDALPQDKLEVLKHHKDKITMMVGDGINDMLALSNASISVSMGEGSKGAMASSNLIIFNNNLENIPYAIKLSNATLKNIKQNLFWAFGYNACMIPIACGLLSGFGITLTPIFASIAMTLSSLSVVFNAQRLKTFKG